jgi:hypothetical protein
MEALPTMSTACVDVSIEELLYDCYWALAVLTGLAF